MDESRSELRRALPPPTTVAAGLLMVVAAVVILGRVGGSLTVRTVDDVAQGLAALVGAAAAYRRASDQSLSRRSRRGWAAMAVGLTLWAAGQTLWCWWEIGQGRPAPFPSLADAGFLGFSVCASVGVYLIADNGRPTSRVRVFLDGVTVAGALVVISWATALGSTVAGSSFDLASAVSLAYPVTDVVLLTVTVQTLSRTRQARSSLVALGVGTAALAVADSSYTYLTAIGRYHTGDPLDLGWIGGFAIIGVAAERARRVGGSVTRARALAAVPYSVLAVSFLVLGGTILAGRRLDGTEEITSLVLVLAVLVRQYLTVRDNQSLMRTVEAREAQLSHQAFHDDLTGLPNRALFHDRVGHALDLHRRDGRRLAVLFCDLDDFKAVNDTLGHRAGDELLARVAERLRGAVRPSDTLARLGGDEFAVLVEGADPDEVGRRMLEVLSDPFTVDGRLTPVRASIGVAGVDADAPAPAASSLLADADTAMYAVKRSGKHGLQRYRASLRLAVMEDEELQGALTEALTTGAVVAHYQPMVNRAGSTSVLEALARWRRDGEMVSPGLFVGMTERLGLVHLLTDRMLDLAVADVARWSSALDRQDLRVSVNVSASELNAEAGLARRVAGCLDRHGVTGDRLVVEITESAVAGDLEESGAVLGQLRAMGVLIALDDFGAGHSSLHRLLALPIDYLKLDGALVAQLEGGSGATVVAALLDLGERLDLTVVAEGVEQESQVEWLRSQPAAPLLQGYALARPMPADDVPGFLSGAPSRRVTPAV